MSELSQNLWLRLKQFPTPIGGLALGIGSLGIILDARLGANGSVQSFTALIAALLLCTLAVKFLLHPKGLLQDLKHPVVGSVAPTFAMGTMIVSNSFVQHHHAGFGHALWLFAVGVHLLFLTAFLRHRLKAWRLHQMVPSWFIPPVGIAVAAVSYAGPHSGFLFAIAQFCMFFALLLYAVLLPLMFYRLIFEDTIPEAAQPTIAILAAPASLSLAAYLNIAVEPTILVVMTLYGIAILMTFTVYLAFFRLMVLPFSPGYAGFTFPMAIGATAQFKTADQLEAWGARPDVVSHITIVGTIELALATVIISYVAFRYAIYLRIAPTSA